MSAAGSRWRIEPLARHRERIGEVAALMHAEWRALAPWCDPAAIEARLARCCTEGGEDSLPHTSLALAADGALLGTASIKLDELAVASTTTHWLGEVFIAPAQRGRGIGSALIEHCIGFAQRRALPALYLYTPDRQALYERFGWRRWRDDMVNGEAVSVMRLALEPAI